jgi:hypothetical protein
MLGFGHSTSEQKAGSGSTAIIEGLRVFFTHRDTRRALFNE